MAFCNGKMLLTMFSSRVANSLLAQHQRQLSMRIFRKGLARMLSDPENKGTQQRHVNFDTLGSWDNRIDFGLLLQESIRLGKPIPAITTRNIGVFSVIGRRPYNEDFASCLELTPELLYFAVFDGHGGEDCARFASEQMPLAIKANLPSGEVNRTNLEQVLVQAFSDVNDAFAKRQNEVPFRDEKRPSSGTTATVCLLRNATELVVGHVGDSRAFLCRDGTVRRLTTDHSAALKSEQERILAAGGSITSDSRGRGLVNGRLAMTRSLGDLDLKPFGVSATPDTRTLQIKHGRDAFIVLTTDGVSDVMNDREIVNAVASSESPAEGARYLAEQALHYSSEDNATALVVPFGAWGKYRDLSANLQSQLLSFGRQLQNSVRF